MLGRKGRRERSDCRPFLPGNFAQPCLVRRRFKAQLEVRSDGAEVDAQFLYRVDDLFFQDLISQF
jgi:hypothetical protein